jgi:hypothetical protein
MALYWDSRHGNLSRDVGWRETAGLASKRKPDLSPVSALAEIVENQLAEGVGLL